MTALPRAAASPDVGVVAPGEGPADACCAPSAPTLLPAKAAADLAAVFKALSDPTRVRVLAHVAASPEGTVCACHLPEPLGISQPTLSHHLKKLTEAGLVTREQRGRWAHYTAVPAALDAARAFLASPAAPTR